MFHPAEYFCRKVISGFLNVQEQERRFVRDRQEFGKMWPDWCGLPMAAVYAMMTNGASVSNAATVMGARITQFSDLTAALLWTRAKVVYRFDPDLALALMSQPIESDDPIPIEIFFQLPHFCIYVDQPLLIAGRPQIGFFAWMEMDANSLNPELRLLFLDEKRQTISVPVLFSPDKTLDGSLKALLESAQLRSTLVKPSNVETLVQRNESIEESEVTAALQLILYLCSDQADVPESEASKRISHVSAGQPRSTRPTQTVDVGYRVGAALRNARSAHAPGSHTNTAHSGTHPAPHVRRAHWHAFWSGSLKGERKLSVRWLHPILVGMQTGEEIQTVVHPVKEYNGKKNNDQYHPHFPQ